MSERICAWIRIGGRIDKGKVTMLSNAIAGASVSTDWGDRPFEPKDETELLQARKEDGWVWLCDDRANYGEFPELERVCRELGLSYTRGSEASASGDAEVIEWRQGMKEPLWQTASNVNQVDRFVSQQKVKNVLDLLEAGLVSNAIAILREYCPDIPPLPPFEIV